jgi:hypothetical protein
MPAEAGIQKSQNPWIPACAGMTTPDAMPAEAGIQKGEDP